MSKPRLEVRLRAFTPMSGSDIPLTCYVMQHTALMLFPTGALLRQLLNVDASARHDQILLPSPESLIKFLTHWNRHERNGETCTHAVIDPSQKGSACQTHRLDAVIERIRIRLSERN